MRDSRKYTIYPSELDVLRAFRRIAEYFKDCRLKEYSCFCPNTRFSLHVNEARCLNADSFFSFLKMLEDHSGALPIIVHSHWKARWGSIVTCGIELRRAHLQVYIEANDFPLISGLHEKIQEVFEASVPTAEKSPYLLRHDLKRTIFLAHRFDESGDAVSRKLLIFLQRLGFDVLEGTGYEARAISQKVADKIRKQDIFICLATPGDVSWIVSEMAHAAALGKYIIILCQEGVELNRGIVGGDHEYMTFPCGEIEKVYTDLLYALPG